MKKETKSGIKVNGADIKVTAELLAWRDIVCALLREGRFPELGLLFLLVIIFKEMKKIFL